MTEDSTYTEVRLNYIDTSAIETEADLSYPVFPDNIIGAPAYDMVKVRYIETEYIKHSERYYDPITKTTKESYYYTVDERTLRTETRTLTDGKLRIDHIKLPDGFEGYYHCEITYYDQTTKNTYKLTANVTDYGGRPAYEPYRYQTYELTLDKDSYRVGDTVTATAAYGGETLTQRPTLFVLYSNGRKLFSLSDNGTFSFTYEDGYVPGARLYAMYFDGERVYTVGQRRPIYDYQQNNTALLELIPDAETYRPGDSATVKIRMTKDGLPLANASVILSIVDEACFALGDQSIDPLNAYYNTYAYSNSVTIDGSFNSYSALYEIGVSADSSLEMAEPEAPAESDSGMKNESASEETDIREDFADNPLFETVYLNELGEAVVKFTVPDNITQWRLTAAGFSADEGALISGRDIGKAQTDVICTLPFFVNVSVSDLYIVGDDIALSAQVYGTALAEPVKVKYFAEISDAGATYGEKTVEALSGQRVHLNMGKLGAGSYYLTLTAEAEGYSDGVRLPFTVSESGVVMTAYKNISPDGISALKPSLYPVNLTFYNKQYDALFKAAAMIRTNYDTRNDSRAAYYAVNSTLREIFGDSGYYDTDLQSIRSDLSSYGGFIPLMEYAEGDVELTAKIAAVVPGVFNDTAKANLVNIAENYILNGNYSSSEEMCAALLILSSLDAGSLSDLYYVKASSANFTLKAHLYLAAAFAYLGDWTTGNDILGAVVKAYGKETDGFELSIEGKNTEETVEFTALALMTAALTDKATADKMAAYLQSHTSTVELYCLELTAYFNTFRPDGDGTDVLVYEVNGEEYRTETSPRGTVTLSLNKSEFESLKIISMGEDIAVRASYKASPDEALGEGNISDTVKISKTVTPYDEQKGLYKVTISYTVTTDRNSDCFTLTDRIPAGARYFTSHGSERSNGNGYSWAYLSNSGQNMTGSIGVWNPTEKGLSGRTTRTYTGSISYIIRGAVRGEFIFEAASAINTRTGTYALSERFNVEISEKGCIAVK